MLSFGIGICGFWGLVRDEAAVDCRVWVRVKGSVRCRSDPLRTCSSFIKMMEFLAWDLRLFKSLSCLQAWLMFSNHLKFHSFI
jgi:hypothetical protein